MPAIAVLVADLASKSFFFKWLGYHERFSVFEPLLYFTTVTNQGVAWGIFPWAHRLLLLLIPLLLAGIFIHAWRARKADTFQLICLGAIFGGAAGNYYDRLVHGAVRDFIDVKFGALYDFPIFNLADAAISISVALMLLRQFLVRQRPPVS